MLRIGVLVSGGGTNLQAIIDRIESGYIKDCSIVTVVSSKPNVYALKEPKTQYSGGLHCQKDYPSVHEYGEALIQHFERCEVGLIVMAGFCPYWEKTL